MPIIVTEGCKECEKLRWLGGCEHHQRVKEIVAEAIWTTTPRTVASDIAKKEIPDART